MVRVRWWRCCPRGGEHCRRPRGHREGAPAAGLWFPPGPSTAPATSAQPPSVPLSLCPRSVPYPGAGGSRASPLCPTAAPRAGVCGEDTTRQAWRGGLSRRQTRPARPGGLPACGAPSARTRMPARYQQENSSIQICFDRKKPYWNCPFIWTFKLSLQLSIINFFLNSVKKCFCYFLRGGQY